MLDILFNGRHGPRVKASTVGSLENAAVVYVLLGDFFAGGWVEGVVVRMPSS